MNHIDKLWNNPALKEKCEKSIEEFAASINGDSANTNNIYQVSALLDFYASIFKDSDVSSDYGLKEFTEKGNKKELEPFLNAFSQFFQHIYTNPSKTNDSSPKLADTSRQSYINIRQENEFSNLTDEILNTVGIKQFYTDLDNYLTKDKKPELYNILFRELEKLSYQLVRCYEKEISSIHSISLDPNTISNEQENLQKKQLRDIYKRIEETFNNQVYKMESTQLDGTSKYLEFEALLQGIDKYVKQDILQERINQTSFINIFNQIKKENGGKIVPDMSVIPHSIIQIANEVEEDIIDKVQDFSAKFISDLKGEILKDSIYSELGEKLRVEINNKIFELLDSRKTIVNTSIETVIVNDCKKCRKEHANFFTKANEIGLESLLSNNKNGNKDNTIHALLKAQFEENFQDLFSIDNTNKLDNIRESILSVFTRQLRIKDCKLGTKEEVIDLEEKLDLGNVIKTKLELDLSQEIQNRQQQKANRIKRLNAKIDHYLQLKQEIQSCFQLPQTNCQLPEVKKII